MKRYFPADFFKPSVYNSSDFPSPGIIGVDNHDLFVGILIGYFLQCSKHTAPLIRCNIGHKVSIIILYGIFFIYINRCLGTIINKKGRIIFPISPDIRPSPGPAHNHNRNLLLADQIIGTLHNHFRRKILMIKHNNLELFAQ